MIPAAAALVLALLWAMVLRPLAIEWSVNPQYSYAWSVPFVALFLLVREWRTRPAPRLTSGSGAIIALVAVLCLLLLPLRVIAEANPDWRLTSWLMALSVAAIALCLAFYSGGVPWVRHFGLVLCLPLAAVPWPVQFEQSLVQTLMRVVASITVEIVNAFGIAAVREGNLIRIVNGVVGVDEACSGIRSLQATLFIAIALGQLFRMTLARRFVLIGIGAAIAFVTNVARTTFLVFVGATRGLPAIHEWHDPAGFTISATCLFALLLTATFLSRKQTPPAPADTTREARHISFALLGAIAMWVVAIEITTELWYRAHERQLIARPAWQADWPGSATALDIPEATRAMLRFNSARSAAWQEAPGVYWWSFFSRWEPGRAALQLVRSHSPDICLPAMGRTFVRELEPIALTTDVGELPFRVYQFTQEGKPLFVFVCIQEDKIAPNESKTRSEEWSAAGRLRATLNGRRNLGQRLLELAVLGYSDFAAARDALAQTVRAVVKPTG